MKKRIALLFLAVLMLLALTACVGPGSTEDPVETTQGPTLPSYDAVEPVQKDGVYQITEPCHLTYLAQHPDKSYALADDIDMYGYEWTPVENFTGKLSGKIFNEFNYTISNLVIKAKEGDTNVGLFRTLSGTVADINFHNITVTCAGTVSGNVGVVAGVAKTALNDVEVKNSTIEATVKDANVGLLCGKAEKDVSSCDVAGKLNVKLAGGTDNVGGGVGYAQGSMASCEIRTDITAEGTGSAGAAGGLVGHTTNIVRSSNYIGHMTVTADASYHAGTLVGNMAGAGIASSYNCARSFTVTGAAAAANDFCGTFANGATFNGCLIRDNFNIEDKLSEAERAMREKVVAYGYQMASYRWIPSKTIVYKDNCPGRGHAQTYEAGKVYFGQPYTHQCSSLAKFQSYLDENHMTVDTLGTDSDALRLLGNDCAELVFWSWSQVEADLTYTQTENAICTGGVKPVGDYVVSSIMSTAEICNANGAQAMYEAYAKAQMGDGLLVGPGHFRLVAEAAYVFRNADGTINPAKSYIVTHEQGTDTAQLPSTHTTCKVNGKYTFSQLFSTNYIPVTVEAYAKGEADVLTAEISNNKLDKGGVGAGLITTNYCPDVVTIRVTDAKGKSVLNESAYPTTAAIKRAFGLSYFKDAVKAMELQEGKEYTYEVFVEAGGQKLCVQTFKFTA